MIKLKSKRTYNNEVSIAKSVQTKTVHTENRVMYFSVDESVSLYSEVL